MSIQIINMYVDAITSGCGLDRNQAKVVVYWVIATYGIDRLELIAILVIFGPMSTGKTTLMKIISQIANLPKKISGQISKSELRDKLKLITTAIIEEADEADEQLLLARYSRQTSDLSFKGGSASQGWDSREAHIFGATVLHRRLPFKDPAVESRSITIRTSYKPGNYAMPTLDGNALAAIAAAIDWSKKVPVVDALDGRAADAWMPLCQAAFHCGDIDFMAYAIGEMTKAIENIKEGQAEEPVQVVIKKLIACAWDENQKGFTDRVTLKGIAKGLKEDGQHITSWQVGQILREQGFEIKTVGGNQIVFVNNKTQLAGVAKKLNIVDELLK